MEEQGFWGVCCWMYVVFYCGTTQGTDSQKKCRALKLLFRSDNECFTSTISSWWSHRWLQLWCIVLVLEKLHVNKKKERILFALFYKRLSPLLIGGHQTFISCQEISYSQQYPRRTILPAKSLFFYQKILQFLVSDFHIYLLHLKKRSEMLRSLWIEVQNLPDC